MGEQIRVLHVFGNLNAGGAESRTMDIYRKIDKEKIQFDFAIHTQDECFFSKEVRSLGGKIFTFPKFNGKNLITYRKSWEQFFEAHPEYKIIHGHQTSIGFLYLHSAKKNNLPIRIAHSRNSNKENLIKKFTSKMSRISATDLFAVSKLAGISEFGKRAVDKNLVKIIPNGIESRKFSFNKEIRLEKRKELGLEDCFAVCHVGRFNHQKNHEFLLEIFKDVKDSTCKKTKLILIGDGYLREEIEEKIVDLGIKDSVILTGVRSDVHHLLNAMDVLVFPSFYEGLPGVVLEAQASGLPSLISDSITDEVKITNLVEQISLNKCSSYWSEKVIKIMNNKINRENTFNEIVDAGFDIDSVTKWYQNFYLDKYRQFQS